MSKKRINSDRALLIRVLNRAWQKSRNGWGWDEESCYTLSMISSAIRVDQKGDLLSYAPGLVKKVSFAAKENQLWCDEKRTQTTLGRYIRRQMGFGKGRISDEQLQQVSELAFSIRYPVEEMVKIKSGHDLMSVYKRSAGSSTCMTGSDSELITMLEENPEKCSVLVFGDDIARALLWTADCGQKVLDRIYPSYGAHIDALNEWAHGKGFYTRKTQGADFRGFTDGKSEHDEVGRGLKITVEKPSNDKYPFLDSFYQAMEDGYDHMILSCKEGFGEYILQQTDGELEDEQYRCSYCNSRDDDGNEVNGDWYCLECFSERYVMCERCGDPHNIDWSLYIDSICETWCQSCADYNASSCHHCSEYFPSYEGTTSNDTCNTFCSDCAEDHLEKCEDCRESFEHDIENGLCDDCGRECCDCGERVLVKDLENDFCSDCGTVCEKCGVRVATEGVNEDDLCESCVEELVEKVEN